MSLRNYYDSTKNEMHFESSEIDTLVISNGTKTIKHFIDSSHNYNIVDESNNVLLQCDSNANVLPCAMSIYTDGKCNALNSAVSTTVTTMTALNAIVSSLQATISGLSVSSGVYSIFTGVCLSVGTNVITSYNVTGTGFLQGSLFSTVSLINFKVFFTVGAGLASVINSVTDGFISGGEAISFTVDGANLNINFVSSISSENYHLSFLPVVASTF